ncbi:mitochondrial glycoprotein [Xylariaceae sp. FL0016]|nr:mitochondrial glycoprotein [Xylariaceae sp. FL0016]
MLSLRVISRSAPRSLARLSSTAIRQSRVAHPSSLSKSLWAPLRTTQFTSAFSTTPLRCAANEVDEELSAKLESELQFEDEMKENIQLPVTVKDFLDNSPFELKDTPGQEDVFLTRKYGNETITVSFSISDLANFEPDMYNEEEDSALTDEELETPEGKRIAEAEAEEAMDADGENAEPAVPCRLNIVVEKPGKGALNIEAIAQDGSVVVENFYYFKDPAMAHSSSPQAVHAAEDIYPGPPFGSLDEDLQILMERYLEERGVTQAMATFVPDYMDVKEQREYQAWLKDVKGFIDA